MKKSLFYIFLLITETVFSQIRDYSKIVDESTLKGKGIIEYIITEINHFDPKSYTNNMILEKARFDSEGKKTFYYTHNFDVVNSVDSVHFNYNNSGDIVEIIEISNDAPVGKEQFEFIAEFGGLGRTVRKTIFKYNQRRQIIKREYCVNEKIDLVDIDNYSYNDKGLIWKHEHIYGHLPKQNSYTEFFYYNKKDQVIKIDQIYLENPKDTLRSTKIYNSDGKILIEYNKEKGVSEKVNCTYKNGKLMSKKWEGEYHWRYGKQTLDFLYNNKGEIIEEQRGDLDRIVGINRFKYNKEGLLVEEHWIDINSDKVRTTLIIEYKK